MAFGWIKNLFSKKGKKENSSQIDSVYENSFYKSGDYEAVNPFFQEKESDATTVEESSVNYNQVDNKAETQAAVAEAAPVIHELGNTLQNIGGMPTIASIETMAGGLKMEKIGKHKAFANALNALERYQTIMEAPRSTTVNEENMSRNGRFTDVAAGVDVGESDAKLAFECMSEFILQAEKAVDSANGLFSKYSSNVQKLTPVFANLLVQAYGILPKLAHIDSLVAPYIIATDHENYTFSEVLNHQVSGGRSGGLATKGVEAGSGSIELNPKKALNVLNNKEKNKNSMDKILQLRRENTNKARMGMKVPVMPIGSLKELSQEAVGEKQINELENSAEAIASAYLSELRLLAAAIDDATESFEFSGGANEREGVHDKQAEHFRMSRLIYRITQNKELLKKLIIYGYSADNKDQGSGYDDLLKMSSLSGMTLSAAADLLNKEARDPSTFARLIDQEGKEMIEGKDYKVGGGQASISILDFKNKRVLRGSKDAETGGFGTEEEQNKALNGIRDEAAGKISQFLGWNVAAQAEATGFMGKNKNESEEHAVFGGSIMDLADGDVAGAVNLVLGEGQEDLVENKRKGQKTYNIFEQGRLVGDMMKMYVLDYIILHGDRNSGNYLLNMDAKDNESMVTAIDNDMLFGYDAAGRRVGNESSKEALIGINDRVQMDYGMKLNAVFPMMTQEIKDTLENLDLGALNELLMPYADRVARMAAVHRAGELKEWAKKVPTCDLTTEEGTKECVNAMIKGTMAEWMKTVFMDDGGEARNLAYRSIANPLIRLIVDSYLPMKGSGNSDYAISVMKTLGLSNAEIKQIAKENLRGAVGNATYKDSFMDISDELFEKSRFAKLSEDNK